MCYFMIGFKNIEYVPLLKKTEYGEKSRIGIIGAIIELTLMEGLF